MLKEQLKLKQEELKKKVEQFNQLQATLNELSQDILRDDGAVKAIQELIDKQTEVTKKEDT